MTLPLIAKKLEAGGCGHSDGCSLLEREVRRLRHEVIRSSTRILGKGACAPAEYLIAWSELRHVLADRLDYPRDIRSRNTVLWFAQPGRHADDVRHASYEDPVTNMDGCRMNAYQRLVILDHWPGDVQEFEDRLGCAVLVLDDRLHRVSLPCRSTAV